MITPFLFYILKEFMLGKSNIVLTTYGGRGIALAVEKDLVRLAKRGDITAFEELVSGYEKKVYNTAYRFFNNIEDARDISQEIFLKIYLSLKDFREDSTFSTWLYRIAVNTCIDYCRKRKGEEVPLREELEASNTKHGVPPNTPEQTFEKKEIKAAVLEAIKLLPIDQKTCIILRDIQGFSYMEICSLLNCPLGTVKSRISRGRRNLRKYIDSELFNKNDV
jgi:RNA polymerase sigma-70 factor (ECF subfamily)